jgi:hypothetical protein
MLRLDSLVLSALVLIVAAFAVWGVDSSFLPDVFHGLREILILAGG